MQSEVITAAIIIIGNEILSGKVQDQNVQFIASELGNLGIRLREVRVIPDIENDIIETVNSLRCKYDYIFTTGGIGPTHDDITAESIAKAFNKKYDFIEAAKILIENYLKSVGKEIREDHYRMAYMPLGAELLLNHETGAPGFKIENVFVMAGVPYIMRSIFAEAKKFLRTSSPIISRSMVTFVPESVFAKKFEELQLKYPTIEMGSYPEKIDGKWKTTLVLRGDNPELIDEAMMHLKKIIEDVTK